MDSSDISFCDVCHISMHRNNWDAHIVGKKHCKMLKQNKQKHDVTVSVSVSEEPSSTDDNNIVMRDMSTAHKDLALLRSPVASEIHTTSQDMDQKSNSISVSEEPSSTDDSNIVMRDMSTAHKDLALLRSPVASEIHTTSQDMDQKSNSISVSEEPSSTDDNNIVMRDMSTAHKDLALLRSPVASEIRTTSQDMDQKSNSIRGPESSEAAKPTMFCEACNISLHQNVWNGHVNGKKHKIQQRIYNKINTSVYVTGVSKFSPADLKKIFSKFGEVDNVTKNPYSAFIQFKEKSAAEKALSARVFDSGVKFIVHKYMDKYNEKQKSKLLPADPVVGALSESQVGIPELPVELPDSRLCPPNENVFEWHVQCFISQVELEVAKYYALNNVLYDVESELQYVLPGCQVLVFGSCGSNLAFKNSDVDLFVQCVGVPPTNFVRKEARVFYKSSKFAEFFGIPGARVPIVKLRHIQTNFKCDLTCSTKLGVCNSRLIKFLISLDPRIKPLIMVIKYWAKVYGITAPQCFTTYSVVMLVIFYLQQLTPPLLPPISTLQRLADYKEFNSGWMCSFCDHPGKVLSKCLGEKSNLTLKELLGGFFQFYRDFDYQNVICPSVGHPVSTELFKSADTIPEEMQLYKKKLKNEPNNAKLKFNTNVMIRTQDPLELNWNITKNVPDSMFYVFTAACKESCKLMAEKGESSLLGSLFSIDKDLLYLPVKHYISVRIGFFNVASGKSSSPGMDLSEQYKLMTESVLLVMRQVMKAEIELYEPPMLSKVQKVNSSQDVHTTGTSSTQSECEDVVYVCQGNCNVIDLRKKLKTELEKLDLSLDEYEKEVCISNALQSCNPSKNFFFYLKISSLNTFKHLNSLEIILSGKEDTNKKKSKKSNKNSFSKEVANFILVNLKQLVKFAISFIVDTKCKSPEFDVKLSLSELFDLKMANLPNLNDILHSKSVGEESPPTSECDKNILHQQHLLLQCIEKDKNNKDNSSNSLCLISGDSGKETIIPDTIKSKHLSVKSSLEGKVTITSEDSKLKHLSAERNLESKAMENVILSKKSKPNAKTQAAVEEFLNSNKPDPLPPTLPPVECLKDDTIDKFSDLLNTALNCETKSSIEKNPFLASIEKVKTPDISLTLSESNKRSLSDLNEEYETQLKNISSKGNERNKRKMDLNCEIVQTKTKERSRVLNENEQYKATDNIRSKRIFVKEARGSQIKPKSNQQRPKLDVEQFPNKYRKPNVNTSQNMYRRYSTWDSGSPSNSGVQAPRISRGGYKQWANPRHAPNPHTYNNNRYFDEFDNNSGSSSRRSDNRHY